MEVKVEKAMRRVEMAEQFSKSDFDGALTRVLSDLQRALDEVQKVAAEYQKGETTPEDAAERIAHKVVWTLPNLHLDALQESAGKLAGLRSQMEMLKGLLE